MVSTASIDPLMAPPQSPILVSTHPPALLPGLKAFHSFLLPPHFSHSFCLSNSIPPVFLIFPEMNCFASGIASAMSWQNIFVSGRGTSLPFSLLPVDDTSKIYNIGSSERLRAEKINSWQMENIPSSFRGKRGP